MLADGTAYLLYASDNNQNFKISKLDSNYYNVVSITSQLNGNCLTVVNHHGWDLIATLLSTKGSTLEAPGVLERNGVSDAWVPINLNWQKYHLGLLSLCITHQWMGSKSQQILHRFSKLDSWLLWASRDNIISQSLAGPWSAQADIAPEATNTYFSQNAFDMPLGSSAIYMGDRWRPDLLGSSRYIWYPLSWSTGSPQIVAADVWSVNLAAGTYTAATGTSYEAESGTISGSATILTDGSFSGGKAVGYLGLYISLRHAHTIWLNPDRERWICHNKKCSRHRCRSMGFIILCKWCVFYFQQRRF